jgi:DNA-binding NarL/FixJ family response regulator
MDATVVGMVSTIDEALNALTTLRPDLVIVDYDDNRVNRDEFLARFVEGEGRLRVVLLSLKEGGSEAIVYDRRTMAASQIED